MDMETQTIADLKATMEALKAAYLAMPLTSDVEALRAAGDAFRASERAYQRATRVKKTPQVAW